MTEKKNFEMDMVRGPVLKKMLRFSLPLMFSSILQILFNAHRKTPDSTSVFWYHRPL